MIRLIEFAASIEMQEAAEMIYHLCLPPEIGCALRLCVCVCVCVARTYESVRGRRGYNVASLVPKCTAGRWMSCTDAVGQTHGRSRRKARGTLSPWAGSTLSFSSPPAPLLAALLQQMEAQQERPGRSGRPAVCNNPTLDRIPVTPNVSMCTAMNDCQPFSIMYFAPDIWCFCSPTPDAQLFVLVSIIIDFTFIILLNIRKWGFSGSGNTSGLG